MLENPHLSIPWQEKPVRRPEINRSYPGVLEEKYAIEHSDDKFEVLEKIAQSRHCLVRGNEFDTEKAAAILLDDFRNGRLGRITLEVPEAV